MKVLTVAWLYISLNSDILLLVQDMLLLEVTNV